MNIQNVYIKNGIVHVVIAPETAADPSQCEVLRMSVENWRRFAKKHLAAHETENAADPVELTDVSVGHSVDEAEYDELRHLSERTEAVLTAARMLSGGDYSERELCTRLKRSYSAETSVAAVALLRRRGYLNEEEQCRRYAERAVRTKRHGALRIRAELLARGYVATAVTVGVDSVSAEEYECALAYWVERKLRAAGELDAPTLRKVIAALMRLGFSRSMILRAISQDDQAHTDPEIL